MLHKKKHKKLCIVQRQWKSNQCPTFGNRCVNYRQTALANGLQVVKSMYSKMKNHHQKGNDSNTTNSKEISVEVIKSNGQCCISREPNCQSESNCDDYMLLNWALMHKLEHCQNLDTSNWENVQILNNDRLWLSKPGTTYWSSGEGSWYAYPILTFLWRHPLSSTVANTMQRAALNFDLTL